ncbi:MAG: ArsR/SmtB family transcription factor [Verrucomicrobiota bacterium]
MPRRALMKFDCLAAMRALGEPSRVRIVHQLLDGPRPVNDLCEALNLQPYNASRHLAVLKSAGLVEVERVSKQRIYRLAETFRNRLADHDRVLDLGCCRFDFNQLPR